MDAITLNPIRQVNGEITIPGSKSLSNRVLLLAALSEGTTQITNLLDSDDVRHMLNSFEELGLKYSLSEDRATCTVVGNGGPISNKGEEIELFLGNAGTAMRPLAAALCLGEGKYTLTGEPRMLERPIGHLVDSLLQAGAEIDYLNNEQYPPLRIKAHGLKGGNIDIDGSVSSQFLTAFLISAPLAKGDITVNIKNKLVSKPYIDITLHLMSQFGVDVQNNNYNSFFIKGNQKYRSPGNFLVEGDASSASYFLAAAAIRGGAVKVNGVGRKSIQGDIRFADALEQMGGCVIWEDNAIEVRKNGPLKPLDVDLNHIPDAAMTIATTALFASGTTTIRNIYNWRVKETDRLSAMATELRKLGAKVIEGEDYISITPPKNILSAEIDTYNDHRMAMCFSLAAMGKSSIKINDPDCTSKTFPNYFDLFKTICQ